MCVHPLDSRSDLNTAPELNEIPHDRHGFVDATAATAATRHAREGCSAEHGCAPWLPTWDGTRNPLVASGWLSEGSDARTQLDYIFTSKGSGLAPQEVSLGLDDSSVPLSDPLACSSHSLFVSATHGSDAWACGLG